VLTSLWLKPALLLSCSLIITQGLFLSLSYGAHEKPPIRSPPQDSSQPGKWVGYGTDLLIEGPLIETEVKGIVILIDSDDLYVIPDPNYRNLAIQGNYLRANINEETKSDTIRKNLDNLNLPSDSPVIKMEMVNARAFGKSWMERVGCTYGPDPGAKQDDCGPGPVKFRINDPYKKGQDLQVGDHIKVTGLYVIELQHVMYYTGCKPPFAFFRGFQKLCWGHAEIHPYNVREIEYVPPLEPGDTNTESHTVVFPVYRQFYDNYEANGVAQNKLVDASRDKETKAEFFIKASDRPPECRWIECSLHLGQQMNPGREQNIVSKTLENGVARIQVRMTEAESVHRPIYAPFVYKYTWSLGWKEGQGPTEDQAMRFTSVIDGDNQQIKLRGFTYSSSMQFHFESLSAATDRFLCSLDGADFVECKSGYTLTDLRLGRHALVVKLDLGGAESLPEVFIWKNIKTPVTPTTSAAAPRIGSGEEYSEQEENSEPQANESFAGYEDSARGFRIFYPAAWQWADTTSGVLFWPDDEEFEDFPITDSLSVLIKRYTKNIDIETQIRDDIDLIKEFEDADSVINVGKILVAGVPAYTYDYEHDGKIISDVYLEHSSENRIFNFEYIGDKKNLENFQTMVKSFEFFSAP
jgi:hypothetical protein